MQGYDRLSVEAVAAEADVTRATIYRRYPSKAELVCAALSAYPDDVEHGRGSPTCGRTSSRS